MEVNKKVVPLHSHLKNGCLKRRRVLLKDWLRGKKNKNFQKKFGSLKIMLTFASPFEKRASQEEKTSSLKRLITVQEASTEKIQFIEKR